MHTVITLEYWCDEPGHGGLVTDTVTADSETGLMTFSMHHGDIHQWPAALRAVHADAPGEPAPDPSDVRAWALWYAQESGWARNVRPDVTRIMDDGADALTPSDMRSAILNTLQTVRSGLENSVAFCEGTAVLRLPLTDMLALLERLNLDQE